MGIGFGFRIWVSDLGLGFGCRISVHDLGLRFGFRIWLLTQTQFISRPNSNPNRNAFVTGFRLVARERFCRGLSLLLPFFMLIVSPANFIFLILVKSAIS